MSLQGFFYANLLPDIGPFLLKIEQNVNYISHLQFGENSVKIRPKIGKLQMFKFTSHLDANIQSTCNATRKALHW